MNRNKWILIAILIGVATIVTALRTRPIPHVIDQTQALLKENSNLTPKISAAQSPRKTERPHPNIRTDWKKRYQAVQPFISLSLPTREEKEELHRLLSDPDFVDTAFAVLNEPITVYDIEATKDVLQSIDVLKQVAAHSENPLRAQTIERLQKFVESPQPGSDTPLGVRKQIAGNKTEVAQILLVHAERELAELVDRVQDPKLLQLINRAIEEITRKPTQES